MLHSAIENIFLDEIKGMFKVFPRSFGSTIILGMFSLGFVLTLMFSYFSLQREYVNQIDKISNRLESIQRGFIKSLTNSLWKLDDEQVKIILESIMRQDDISYVEVKEKNIVLYRLGKKVNESLLSQTFPLVLNHKDKNEHVGDLYVEATTFNINKKLYSDALYIAISEFIKIAIFGIGIYLFIKFIITRHLDSITRFFNHTNIYESHKMLILNRKFEIWKSGKDNFDFLVDSINVMKGNLHKELQSRKVAQQELESLNRELEIRVLERTKLLLETNKVAAVGEMAAGIAHEVNSPLSVIYGICKRINKLSEKEQLDKEELGTHTEKIIDTVNRIFFITNALQVLSHTHQEGENRKFTAITLIDDTMKGLKEIYKSTLGNLSYVTNRLPEEIILNQNSFFQLLFNVISYRQKKMKVSSDSWMRIEFSSTPQDLIITFFDGDLALTQEEKESILDPFYVREGKDKGSHLVLSTIKPISDRMDAKIVFTDIHEDVYLQVRIPLGSKDEFNK